MDLRKKERKIYLGKEGEEMTSKNVEMNIDAKEIKSLQIK